MAASSRATTPLARRAASWTAASTAPDSGRSGTFSWLKDLRPCQCGECHATAGASPATSRTLFVPVGFLLGLYNFGANNVRKLTLDHASDTRVRNAE